jgi:hypothetical protein
MLDGHHTASLSVSLETNALRRGVASSYLNYGIRGVMMVGRNQACPCGSGKKYKKCCENERQHVHFAPCEEGENPVQVEKSVKMDNIYPRSVDRTIIIEEEQMLPQCIMEPLEQFFLEDVALLQKRTQAYYIQTLELFHQYLSIYYGKNFDWSMLDEDRLVHFLSIWYLDHAKVSFDGAKIFLNILKHWFRWLQLQEIASIYPLFKKAYIPLIHALPFAVEAQKWFLQHAVSVENKGCKNPSEMYMLTISPTGPLLFVAKKWMPVQLPDFCLRWTNHRFWIKGSIEVGEFHCYFTQIEGVYPVMEVDKPLQALTASIS